MHQTKGHSLKLQLVSILLLSFSLSISAQTNQEINDKLNNLAMELQSLKQQQTGPIVNFGGYGEIIYTKTEKGEEKSDSSTPEFDNKRFILFVGYDFSSKWRLVSEIEVEHANEIYIEQGYIDYLHSDTFSVQFGTFLLPVGIMNLVHEPTTFLGVQRSQSETRIIPSTWRENGIQTLMQKDGQSFYAYATSGLKATVDFNSSGIRKGRQKASKTNAQDLALGVRYDYTFKNNSILGFSYYSAAMTYADGEAPAQHTIYDVHYGGQIKAIQFKFMWVISNLTDTDKLNTSLGLSSEVVAEQMEGSYFELGYDLNYGNSKSQIIPFIRYEDINTQRQVNESFEADDAQDETYLTFGVNYKPLSNIVFKVDYTQSKNEAKSGANIWNTGVGWNF